MQRFSTAALCIIAGVALICPGGGCKKKDGSGGQGASALLADSDLTALRMAEDEMYKHWSISPKISLVTAPWHEASANPDNLDFAPNAVYHEALFADATCVTKIAERAYRQGRNIRCNLTSYKLTESDGLNGVTYRGAVSVYASLLRDYPNGLLGQWRDWGAGSLQLETAHVECRDGKWSAVCRPTDGEPVKEDQLPK